MRIKKEPLLSRNKKRLCHAIAFLALFLVEAFIALYVHDNFVRPYMGDVLVVIVVYFFIRIIIPEGFPLLPLYVFLFAVAVEISQYFHLASSLGLDKKPVLAIILGGVFDWMDILCYALGCVCIWVATILFRRSSGKPRDRG